MRIFIAAILILWNFGATARPVNNYDGPEDMTDEAHNMCVTRGQIAMQAYTKASAGVPIEIVIVQLSDVMSSDEFEKLIPTKEDRIFLIRLVNFVYVLQAQAPNIDPKNLGYRVFLDCANEKSAIQS